MRCPDCRQQYGRFTAAPNAHLWPPTGELVCPHCGAGLRVGWWPAAGVAVLMAVAVAAGIGFADAVVRELGMAGQGVLPRVLRQVVRVAIVAAVVGPGMYAVWVFGWYARRPAVAGQPPAEPDRGSV